MQNNTPPPGNWKKEHDEYLSELFRKGPTRGGLDPVNINRRHIEDTVIPNFFPGRNPTSFAVLYRRKARQWQVSRRLTGLRKRSKYIRMFKRVILLTVVYCIVSKTIGIVSRQKRDDRPQRLEAISIPLTAPWFFRRSTTESILQKKKGDSKKQKDNSVLFADEAEEATDLQPSDAETEEEEPETEPEPEPESEDEPEEEEEQKPPPTPPKKMPKVKTEKKTEVNDLAKALEGMNVALSNANFDLTIRGPWKRHLYTKGNYRRCKWEMLVPPGPKKAFRNTILPGGMQWASQMVVPSVLYDKDRMQVVNEEEVGFTEDNHEATAYNDVAAEIENLKPEGAPLLTPAITFNCPFKVDENYIKWSVQHFAQDDEEYMDKMVCPDCFCYNALLVVELKGTKPVRKRLAKGTEDVYKPRGGRRSGGGGRRGGGGGGGGGGGVGIAPVGRGGYNGGGVDARDDDMEDADLEYHSSYEDDDHSL